MCTAYGLEVGVYQKAVFKEEMRYVRIHIF